MEGRLEQLEGVENCLNPIYGKFGKLIVNGVN